MKKLLVAAVLAALISTNVDAVEPTLVVDTADWVINQQDVQEAVKMTCSDSSDFETCQDRVYKLMGHAGRMYVVDDICQTTKEVNNQPLCPVAEGVVNLIGERE